MANDALHGGPPRPNLGGSSPSDRERRIAEGSEPSVPSGGTYFLGRYRVVDEIGVGGMASVHLARADGPGGFQKWVAIKRIHRHLAEDDQFIRMFLDEARIAARISHPNVAQVFDLGKHRDTYWIAMEYLHGEPLREIMRVVEEAGAPPMGAQLAAKVIADSADGLHAAHELRDKDGKLLNLVHRDVTPHNLFLTYDGAVKVVDFGIAKVTGRLSTTRAGTLKGKLAYMSPEQVHGVAIDRRTDIFALGVVLWELTTGRRLFRMDSDLETLERVQACVVPPPSSIIENYPVELESIVMRALAKDPNKRFPTARDMSRALQQYVMRSGAFIGPEEIGSYVKQVLTDRFQKREAHLQWAAEVTQTVSLEQLEAASEGQVEESSIPTYASDVQEVPRAPRPAAGAPAGFAARPPTATMPAHMPPVPATVPMPRPPPPGGGALPAPAPLPRPPPAGPRPLPQFEGSGGTSTEDLLQPEEDDELAKTRVVNPLGSSPSNSVPSAGNAPKTTMLGLGVPAPAAGSPPLPSFTGPPSNSVMHDYAAEDEDLVTTVMESPADEAEESHTISTVHEPAKSQKPAPTPDDAIVVNPTLLANEPGGHPAQPWTVPDYPPNPGAIGMPVASPNPQQQRSSVLIAVIAAATTLIALTLTAMVVLKITDAPKERERSSITPVTPATTTTTGTTAQTTTTAPPIQTAIVPVAPTTAEKAVDPSTLPKETEPKSTAKPTTTSTGKTAAVPKPTPVSGMKTVPPTTAPKGGGEPGYLTIMCVPGCDSISAGGRNLGPSPVVRAALPPGNVGVVLRASGKKTKSLGVTIVSGQTTARRVTMD